MAACINAVLRSRSAASILGCAASKASTAASSPARAASISGVMPCSSAASTAAPRRMSSVTAGAEPASAARASAPRPNSSRADTSAGSARISRLGTSPSVAASHSASRLTPGSFSCAAGSRLDGGPCCAAAAPGGAVGALKPSWRARASQCSAAWLSGGSDSANRLARLNAARALPWPADFSSQPLACAGSRGPFTPLR